MRKYILSFIACFLLSGILIAQKTLTLRQAVEKGLGNSFDIRTGQINKSIANRRLKAANKERLPTINLRVDQLNSYTDDNSPTAFFQNSFGNRALSLSADGDWVLFDAFQAKNNKQRYKLNVTDQTTKELQVIENTVFTVFQTYYEALIKKEALEVAKESENLSKERMEDAQLKESLGQVSRYDALRFENALLLDNNNVLRKEQELEVALIQLNSAMGNKEYIPYELTAKLDYEVQEYDLPKLKRQLAQQNKDLLNQDLAIELAQLNTKTIKNSTLPTLRVNAGASQRLTRTRSPQFEDPLRKGNTLQFNLGLSANYTLFDGGQRKRAAQESQLLEQVEVVKKEQLQTNIGQNLTNSIHSYQKQAAILEMTDKLLKNLELNIQLEQDRYKNGFSSALDFRAVQLEYINTQLMRLETIYQLVVNELTILRLTGTLTKNWGRNR